MKQIKIPQYLWLHPHLYDYKQFTLNDIRDIYNSPLTLIQDFEKIPGFVEHCDNVIKSHNNKNKKIINNNKINDKINILRNLKLFSIIALFSIGNIAYIF